MTARTAAPPGTRWRWLAYAAITGLPLAILWRALDAGLVSDDIFFAGLYRLGSWRELALGAWPHSMGQTDGWRPLVLLTYAMTMAWTDQAPATFRLFNVLLHGLNAALLAGLVSGLTGRRATGVVAGALFAVHPVVHENVVWISGRTYPIAAAFGLALLWWSLGAPRRNLLLQHGVGCLLFACALASYEFAVVVPLLLAAVLLVNRLPGDWTAARATARFVLPYAGVLLAYLAFRWLWLTDLRADILVAARASSWAPGVGPIHERLVRNGAFLALKLLAGPWFDRGSEIGVDPTAMVTLGVCLLAVVTLGRQASTRPLLAMWLVWIAVAFLPVAAYAGFADRFAYLSAAGLCGLIGTAVAGVSAWRPATRAAVAGALLALAVGWSLALRDRADDWVAAGRQVDRVVRAALRVEPGPDRATDLHFIGVPRRHGAALSLITYFPQAVWRHYDPDARTRVDFHMWWQPADEVLAAQTGTPCVRDVRIYAWDADTQAMRRLWSCTAS